MLQRLLLIDVGVVILASLLAYARRGSHGAPHRGALRACTPHRQRTDGRDPSRDRSAGRAGRADAHLQHDAPPPAAQSGRPRAGEPPAPRTEQELQATNEILEQLSITDGLTKLHNHRFFQDHLTREIKRAKRTGEPLAMILLRHRRLQATERSPRPCRGRRGAAGRCPRPVRVGARERPPRPLRRRGVRHRLLRHRPRRRGGTGREGARRGGRGRPSRSKSRVVRSR